jgi:glycerol-3-phosphate cytidylyltransferase
MSEKYRIGYTQGTFDMFHVGHLNLLRNAKLYCERLIVGVNSDSLVEQYKSKVPIVNEECRAEILKAIKYVDDVIIVDTLDKNFVRKSIYFDVVFIGDDWKGSPRWQVTEENLLKEFSVKVIYLKHTEGISSSILRRRILK